jgi:hypothetical protein
LSSQEAESKWLVIVPADVAEVCGDEAEDAVLEVLS